MRAVFLGTPEIAVPSLERMIAAGHDVALIVTQPDRPKGRGQALTAPPVKLAARAHGIEVFQPERVRRPEAVEKLRAVGADVMAIIAFGQIIPQTIIDLVPHGIINVHASLLPKYRGAAPIQWAIANGETVTGVTTMRIDAGLDTGDMLLRAELSIGPDETAEELGARVAVRGADLLVETLDGLSRGTIVPEKQNDSDATHAPILKKEDGWLDWTQPASMLHNRVRGFQPWPGGWTRFRGQALHVWRTRVAEDAPVLEPGLLARQSKRWFAGCAGPSLELLEVQLEGKKRVTAQEFANGQRLAGNESLEVHR